MSGAPRSTVLCLGQDETLLKTRCAILRVGGFEVLRAIDRNQAIACSDYFMLQAAVICHTFKPALQDALEREIHLHQQGVPVLKLREDECNPESLIACTRRLVCQNLQVCGPRQKYVAPGLSSVRFKVRDSTVLEQPDGFAG